MIEDTNTKFGAWCCVPAHYLRRTLMHTTHTDITTKLRAEVDKKLKDLNQLVRLEEIQAVKSHSSPTLVPL